MADAPNEGEDDTRQHELVIVRRRPATDDAPHKGGAWKVAHADFMTALMAFFIVMWLTNATDDKTVTGVANYFNPMRLSDATTRPKGVFSMEPADGKEEGESETKSKGKEEKKGQKASGDKGGAVEYSEEDLFSNPYEALDKLAEQADRSASADGGKEKSSGGAARAPGEAWRDPFNPDVQYGPLLKGGGKGDNPGDTGREAGTGRADAKSGADAEAERKSETESERLQREIAQAFEEAGFAETPGIEVTSTSEGLLISVTDQFGFEMFGIASAQPKPELVVLMDKIGRLIAGRTENIVIRGHTDGRPFRSRKYDNWRLSTARAHMANYMLVRSGVEEDRVSRIEGHADHALRIRSDPMAAPNRRIEILLLEEKS
jgi:chemotaxis protein MotB